MTRQLPSIAVAAVVAAVVVAVAADCCWTNALLPLPFSWCSTGASPSRADTRIHGIGTSWSLWVAALARVAR